MRVRIIGAGKAGKSLGTVLESAGWHVRGYLGRKDELSNATADTDVLVIATPDKSIAKVAKLVEPHPEVLVLHLSGAEGLNVLEGHPRRAALHPLVSLPSAELGAQRLVGAWFAMAGDPQAELVVDALKGRVFPLAESARATYHAAAVIASNHLVALLGQVERIAALADVPFEVMLELAQTTLENVKLLGPTNALTGPAARGDTLTIAKHLKALPTSEHATYQALATEAQRLAQGQQILQKAQEKLD